MASSPVRAQENAALGGRPFRCRSCLRSSRRELGRERPIVLTRKLNGPLDVVPATGGVLAKLTELDSSAGEPAHLFPQVLPGGRGVLFTLRKGRDFGDTAASTSQFSTRHRKAKGRSRGRELRAIRSLAPVFCSRPSVFSDPFDLNRLSVTGPPIPLSENVVVHRDFAFGHFDVSGGGTLVFLESPPSAA